MAKQDRPASLGALQEEGAIWIEYIDITTLKIDPDNPKDHDIGALTQSIGRFGYLNPMAINEETGTLIYGHGRLESLLLGLERNEHPPAHVFARHDTWYAPVVRGVHLDPDTGLAYIIADNQMTFLGGWDEPKLLSNLKRIAGPTGEGPGLMGTGFTAEDMDHIARALEPSEGAEPLPHIDQAERLKSKWGTEHGQLWEIPSTSVHGLVHRLLCGDAADKVALAYLMGDRLAAVVMTDPPYGIDHQRHRSGKRSRAKKGDAQSESEHYDLIGGDALTGEAYRDFLFNAFTALRNHVANDAAWYVWHASNNRELVRLALASAGVREHQEICWVKDNFYMGRQDYHWRHESAIYGWGDKHQFYGERNQSTVWEVHRDRKLLHPTIKPMALYMKACRNNTRHGEIIVDTFAGTGPAILAAERTGRVGYCMELAPKYVAVILQRCREMGLEPELSGA
jgi:DNA modification methylase